MNKKAYITPEVEVINMETVEMIAASVRIVSEGEGGDEMLSNDRRGTWGNLWE